MSKDFDAERTAQIDPSLREFTIGGHQFTVRVATAPEVYTRYWDALRDSVSPDGRLSNSDFLALLDETVLALIVSEQADEWQDVRVNADPPITIRTISEVVDYCMAVQNGRDPTESNSSSNGSPPRTSGLKSTDESGSPAAKASTA